MTKTSIHFLVVLLLSIVFSLVVFVEATDEDAVLVESNLVLAKSASSKDQMFLKKRDSLLDTITKNANKKDDPNENDSHSAEHKDSDGDEKKKHKKSDPAAGVTSFGFLHAFFASLSVIVVSEIGDKTFFIAAIMAMKHSRSTVYTGAMFALGLMTLLSAVLGNILTKLIPRSYTYYLSSILFALFGIKMLHEGWHMDHSDASDEYEEANSTLKESEEKSESLNHPKDLEAGLPHIQEPQKTCTSRRFVTIFRKYLSPIFLQAFILTFLAEWGDRSQISTIILGARENIFGTVLGGTLGHGACTGLAVLGGRLIAQRISVRTVTLTGAFVFLFFAFSAFFIDPDSY